MAVMTEKSLKVFELVLMFLIGAFLIVLLTNFISESQYIQDQVTSEIPNMVEE